MAEGHTGKVASPADGDRDSADGSQDQVTQRLPQVEAFEGVLPHTVQGMSVIGFSQNFLKCDLETVKRVK